MAVSKRTRYEVLRRDNHTCRYCGLVAGATELTVDHVVPTSLGGTDDPANLVAACKDCNAGKSSSSPDAATVAQATDDALRWSAAMQVAAGLMSDDVAAERRYSDTLDQFWSQWSYGSSGRPVPRPAGWRGSLSAFRRAGLPVDLLVDAAELALGKDNVAPDATWRYFCGIAWKRVTELQEKAREQLAPESDEDTPACVGGHACECEASAYQAGIDRATGRWIRRYSTFQHVELSGVCDAEGWAWFDERTAS
jgi:hypothetical protein